MTEEDNSKMLEEWRKMQEDTVNIMIKHVEPFITPISYSEMPDFGRHHGSGSYFETENAKYLITNEHVARKAKKVDLQCQFYKNESIFKLKNKFFSELYPIDVSINKIEQNIWKNNSNAAQAIPLDRFAERHNPVKGEMLFLVGYSGERSSFSFNTLICRATPYLTQESQFPQIVDEGNEDYHFSLFYPPDFATSVDGTSSLPDPHGLSGSLVWDTKRVSCYHNNIVWDPSMAKVTGIVWAWPSSSSCLLATKVEKFKLNELLEKSNVNY